jgi:hypothetical protein
MSAEKATKREPLRLIFKYQNPSKIAGTLCGYI